MEKFLECKKFTLCKLYPSSYFYTKKTLLAILRIVFYRLPERVLHDLPLKSYIKRPENCHHQ